MHGKMGFATKWVLWICMTTPIFCLSVFGANPAKPGATKLAIVDVGRKDKVSKVFLDLLLVAFGNKEGVKLLERQEMDKLLREHELAVSLGGKVDAKEAVRVGRLTASDTILMLDMADESGSQGRLRSRLVDAHLGLKIWDSYLILGSDAADQQHQAEELARKIAWKLSHFHLGKAGSILVSLGTFRSEEITHSLDSLSSSLSAGIEQHLGLLPHVVVLERESVRPLVEERNLTEGLPEALQSSTIIVDGTYKLDREGGADSVLLSIRCRRNSNTIMQETIKGSLKDLEDLYGRAAGLISAGTKLKTVKGFMDPAAEAALQLAEGNPEAAYALQPNDTIYALRVFQTISINLNDLPSAVINSERAASLIRILLERPSPKQVANAGYAWGSETEWAINNFWHYHLQGNFRSKSFRQIALSRDPRTKGDFQRLHKSLAWAFKLCGECFKSKNSKAYHYYLGNAGDWVGEMCLSPEEEIEMSRNILTETARLFKEDPSLSHVYSHSLIPVETFQGLGWTRSEQTDRQYASYLEEMAQNKEPLVRAGAEMALVFFHGDYRGSDQGGALTKNPTKAKEHLFGLSRVLSQNLIGKYEETSRGFDIISWIGGWPLTCGCVFSKDPAEDLAIKTRYTSELADAALAAPKALTIRDWNGVISSNASNLEQSGQPERAVDILMKIGKRGMAVPMDQVKVIKQHHPDIFSGTTNAISVPFTLKHCFSLSQSKKHDEDGNDVSDETGLRRIFEIGQGFIIVYEDDTGVGLLDLDKGFHCTGRKHAQGIPRQIDNGTSRKMHLLGPSVVMNHQDVFVGLFNAGILVFREGEKPKRMTETTGLPGDSIEALAILNGNLYAIIGSGDQQSGLVEINIEKGKSRILFSTQTKNPSDELDGRPIRGVLADTKKQCLWLLMGAGRGYQPGIYAYDPSKRSFSRKKDKLLDELLLDNCDSQESYLKRSSGQMLIQDVGCCIRTDADCNVISSAECRRHDIQMVVVGEHVVCADTDHILPFKQGEQNSKFLTWDMNIRKMLGNEKIQDLCSTPTGLLILTDKGLWMMPELKSGRK